MVRLGGLKGVYVRDPSTIGIIVSQSVVKFIMDGETSKAMHETLCMVYCAQHTPVFLREIINIICSLSKTWKLAECLLEMQAKELQKAAMVLTDCLCARDRLTVKLHSMTKFVFGEFDLSSEPCWWSVLQCEYLLTIEMLRKKNEDICRSGCSINRYSTFIQYY